MLSTQIPHHIWHHNLATSGLQLSNFKAEMSQRATDDNTEMMTPFPNYIQINALYTIQQKSSSYQDYSY